MLQHWAEQPSRPIRLQQVPLDATSGGQTRRSAELGLALWGVWKESELIEAVASLVELQHNSSHALRIVYVAPEIGSRAGLLVEAGAHWIVGQLPSLQRGLLKMLQHAPTTEYGVHPLTSGLIERLPWSVIE